MAATAPVHDERGRIAAVRALELLDTAPEERFDRATRMASRLLQAPMAAVALIDVDRHWAKSRLGGLPLEVPRTDTFCDVALAGDGVLVVEDASADERFAQLPAVVGPPHVRFYAGRPLIGRGGHHVGTLCVMDVEPRTLDDAGRRALDDLASWVEQELAIDHELARAADVQRSLIPSSAPGLPGHEIAGRCLASSTVAGDFYDWFPVRGGVAFTVADVMGKGIGAALQMATVRAVLRSSRLRAASTEVRRREDTAGPALALAGVAAAVGDDLGQTGSFVTAFHAHLATSTGEVRYADAGHGLSLVARADGTLERPDRRGLPLGVDADGTWPEGTIVLGPGDALAAFSDGLLDALGEPETPADVDLLFEEVARRLRGAPSADAAVDALCAEAGRLSDDLTVVVVRRCP